VENGNGKTENGTEVWMFGVEELKKKGEFNAEDAEDAERREEKSK
jgi:hypothetical protein